MSATNSSSSYLGDITRATKNALEILNALALVSSSSTESVDVSLTLDNNTVTTLTVPSLGFIKSELNRLDSNITNLSGLSEKDVLIRQQDGTYKRIIAVNLSPAPRRISSLSIPSTFVPQDNYFFNNLMSPLMVVKFDLTGKIDSTVKSISVRRVIVDIDTSDKKSLFESSFKGRNDLSFDDSVIFLTNSILNFNIDDEVVDLPISTPRYYGDFDVIKILDQVQGQTNVRRYTLGSLSYTDSTSKVKSNQVIKPGDVLIKDSSTFSVLEVDTTKNIVTLQRLQGADIIEIGTGVLSIQSELFSSQVVSVPVAVNEYQLIFLKPISDNVASSEWSSGVGIYSNDLIYQSASGKINITDFYNTKVLDLSEDLLSHAREKRVSILTGSKPSTPQIIPQNFVVQRLNDQLDNTQSENEISDINFQIQVNDRKIASLAGEIDKLNQNLTSSSAVNISATPNTQAYQSSKDDLQKQIDSLNELNSGLLTKAQNLLNQNPNISTTSAKYAVFGFWQIPAPMLSTGGRKEEVVAFRVRYRYLPVNDSSASAREIPFTSQDGTSGSAYFSRWQEMVTKPRTKVVQSDGTVVWTQSDIQDPNQVNTQQLQIAITQGERVEIQVSSLSEAGWPSNPIESDPSSSIIVDFPDSLVTPNISNLVTSVQTRLAQQGLQDSVTNLGITEHIKNSTQVASTYVAHTGDEISYSISGSVLVTINQKIKELEDEITALKSKIDTAKGMLKVTLRDPFGNLVNVSNGATVTVNAGFYTEDIKIIPESDRYGAIVTKRYDIILENSSSTPLMLISQFPGLLSDKLPSSPGSVFNGVQVPQDYSVKQYNIVPMGIASVPTRDKSTFYNPESIPAQPVPYQSRQQASQFLYIRNVSLNGSSIFYDYFSPATKVVPQMDSSFNAPTDANVWNNSFDPNNTDIINGTEYLRPLGGGSLTSFCISVDHPMVRFVKVGTGQFSPSLTNPPALNTYFNSSELNSTVPSMASNAPFRYPQFFHTSGFAISTSDNLSKPKPQASYSEFISTGDWPFPMKLGFNENDTYLIGSDTVGSYLFMQTPSIETIKIHGTGLNSFSPLETGSNNAITIPIIFQYRMTDRLNNVGGVPNSTITNLTTIRGLGIDITTKGDPQFSFDFILSASYISDGSTKYTSQMTSTVLV